jgi:hypothetical protein
MDTFYKFMVYYVIALFLVLVFQKCLMANEIPINYKLFALNVKMTKVQVDQLKEGLKTCKTSDNVALAIIMVESSFTVDAYNKNSKDYGLMQINEWHVKRLYLNKDRLLSDIKYNVTIGCDILNWFTSTYSLGEAISRYNCGTKKSCIKYRSTKRYLERVLYFKLFLDRLGRSIDNE